MDGSELRVGVEGIALWGRCGVTDEERAVGQRLVVDVQLVPRETVGLRTDDLSGTVDYGSVVSTVREAVETRSYRLIERLADEIATALTAEHSLREVRVCVRKPAPPVGLAIGSAFVEVVRRP